MEKQGAIRVYGVDHSPWVQGVLLALHARKLPCELVSHPPKGGYGKHGVVMPQCRWPDGSVTSDSFDIMRELERRYPGENLLPADDDQTHLERLFLTYALARTGPGKKSSFLVEWMRMPSGRGASFASCFRAFMFLYFFCLIAFGRRALRARGRNPDDMAPLAETLKPWSAKLAQNDYLAGAQPGFIDYALFGHVQCMLTGLTDESIPILRAAPHLSEWVMRMREGLHSDYPDFTKRLMGTQTVPTRASRPDQFVFALTLIFSAAFFPVTLVLLADAFRRRSRNHARTGARLGVR